MRQSDTLVIPSFNYMLSRQILMLLPLWFPDQWYHVTLIYHQSGDARTIKLYMDGTLHRDSDHRDHKCDNSVENRPTLLGKLLVKSGLDDKARWNCIKVS